MFCKKLGSEQDPLDYVPIPGEVGERIFKEISLAAWNLWLIQQTKLINEYRLDLLDPKAQSFLDGEMMQFLFDE